MPISSCLENFSIPEPSTTLYVVYVPIFSAALICNICICLAYIFWKSRILVKRKSALFLLRSQSTLDCLACFVFLCNLGTNSYTVHYQQNYREVPLLVLFYSIRNILLGIEMFTLSLTAVDRMMAVLYPLSQRWTVTSVRVIFSVGVVFIVLLDGSARLLLLFEKENCKLEDGEEIGYAVFAIFIVLMTYTAYTLLFCRLCLFWKRQRLRRVDMASRQMMWNLQTTSANSSCQQSHESLRDNANSTQMNAEKRLALVLFIITVSHTLSIVPLALYNFNFISFPGYELYYLFYWNGVINPMVLLITRPELQQYVRTLFVRPKVAFQHI